MSYDSRGTFIRVHNWEQDRLNNVEIASDRHDQEDDNFAEGLSLCYCRDGRAAATGNFNLGGYKIKNLGTGTASTDAVNKGQMDTALNAKANSNAVVALSGTQTIAGNKTFTADINVEKGTPSVYFKHTGISKGVAPEGTPNAGIVFHDTNGNLMGRVRQKYAETKNNIIELLVYKANSSTDTATAALQLVYPATGSAYLAAPASDANGSVVTTVNKSKADNGYYELGNGLIIQWGKTANLSNNPASPVSTTLPKAFTSTNYKVILTIDNGSTTGNETGLYVVGKSTTAFTAVGRGFEGGPVNKPAAFIAIGY